MIHKSWVNIADSVTGSKEGRHCHWCSQIKNEDGSSFCDSPYSKFNNGDRIRTYDGLGLAVQCKYFELNHFYTKKCMIGKNMYIAKNLTKNKSFEAEIINSQSHFVLSIELQKEQDHAGLHIRLGLLGKELSIKVYDNRHWNYVENKWEEGDNK